LWAWASSASVRGAAAEELRAEMLKTNYRLDAQGHPELVAQCALVAERMEVTAPVTMYQSTAGAGMNACLCFFPGEVHIVFSGPILATLKEQELSAVLAHELAHYRLWEIENGDFLVADRLLSAAANDSRAAWSHAQTARRFQLYTEIYADRGACVGCGELDAAVAALVKTETGLAQVSGASYLRQAEEIFSREAATAKGIDHPETFIRARALQLWREGDEELDSWLAATIEGPLTIDSLDLIGQGKLTALTRRFLGALLRPKWFQTAAVLAHAKSFFTDFAPAREADDALVSELVGLDGPTREYFCYLMLDFAVVDRELNDVPLALAFDWAGRFEATAVLEKLLTKELGLGKRPLAKLRKDGPAMLAKEEAVA